MFKKIHTFFWKKPKIKKKDQNQLLGGYFGGSL